MTSNAITRLRDFLNITVNKDGEYSVDITGSNQNQGDGYLCQVVFVTLTHTIETRNIHLVIKQPRIKDDGTLSTYTDPHFEVEIFFYQTIWPTLKRYYEETSGFTADFIPKCFTASKNDIPRVVLQNIKMNGFVPFDMSKPFDEEHFTKIFETYGTYHGISMALRVQDIEKYRKLTSELPNRFEVAFADGNYFPQVCQLHARHNKQLFDQVTENFAVRKLEIYAQSCPRIMRECSKYDGSHAVILHGDCWSNNMMFSYDENGKLQDIKLLDFQIVSSGSPVYDLSYCFYSGGSGEAYDKLDYYLKIYHDSLSNTLREFGLEAAKLYPFDTLKDEWKKYCKFGFIMGLFLWRIKLVDKDNIPDIIDYKVGDELQPVRIAPDKEDEYRQRIRELVFHMYHNDFL